MKIVKEGVRKSQPGTRVLTVELQPGEKLIAVNEDKFYRLGSQHEDIVPGYVLTDSLEAHWCHIGQKWEWM